MPIRPLQKLAVLCASLMLLAPFSLFAAAVRTERLIDHWVGYAVLAIFVIAYALVMSEEFTHLRKSKPVILAAGLIWILIAWVQIERGVPIEEVNTALRHNFLEYAELMFFLLAAMTYINAMDERRVFAALRTWMIARGLGYRQLFWLTGGLAFCISPVADNLTTALLMCAVVMAVGHGNRPFVMLACINIVVAANAGGAFSPFGDITTLMVWQKALTTPQGPLDFWSFFHLFLPSLVNWLVPAAIMHFSVPNMCPNDNDQEIISMRRGARRIIVLFLLTIATAVALHHFLHLPPVLGMITGMAYLQFFGYYLKITHRPNERGHIDEETMGGPTLLEADMPFDIFRPIARAEWDTLLFFYGVVLCVGGIGYLGHLSALSELIYVDWGATQANVTVGLLSAVIDNIPVMFAVLSMMPDMSLGQWLLVTLTAGVGGSLLSIGSAAGVALMGQSRGHYTFFGHLRWTPVIGLGYALSILVHLWVNQSLF
jgi:NhaD family Na+/H+ antiporter